VPAEIYIYISPFIIPHFAGFVNQNFYADPIVLLTSICDPPDPTLHFNTAAARVGDLFNTTAAATKTFCVYANIS
jgi:hypothetical protein